MLALWCFGVVFVLRIDVLVLVLVLRVHILILVLVLRVSVLVLRPGVLFTSLVQLQRLPKVSFWMSLENDGC